MFDNAITIAFQMMVFGMLWVSIKLERENRDTQNLPIQWVMFIVSFFMQLINIDLMRQIATDAGKAGIATTVTHAYHAWTFVTVVVVLYSVWKFVLYLYLVTLDHIAKKRGD